MWVGGSGWVGGCGGGRGGRGEGGEGGASPVPRSEDPCWSVPVVPPFLAGSTPPMFPGYENMLGFVLCVGARLGPVLVTTLQRRVVGEGANPGPESHTRFEARRCCRGIKCGRPRSQVLFSQRPRCTEIAHGDAGWPRRQRRSGHDRGTKAHHLRPNGREVSCGVALLQRPGLSFKQ